MGRKVDEKESVGRKKENPTLPVIFFIAAAGFTGYRLPPPKNI